MFELSGDDKHDNYAEAWESFEADTRRRLGDAYKTLREQRTRAKHSTSGTTDFLARQKINSARRQIAFLRNEINI